MKEAIKRNTNCKRKIAQHFCVAQTINHKTNKNKTSQTTKVTRTTIRITTTENWNANAEKNDNRTGKIGKCNMQHKATTLSGAVEKWEKIPL